MKTRGMLIALFFSITLAACGTGKNQHNLTPISRWALAVTARVHPPRWMEPSDSCAEISRYREAIMRQDLNIATQIAERPDLIEDSILLPLSGTYVKLDTLSGCILTDMARFDTAANMAVNYMIDYRKQYSSEPDSFIHKPIERHMADVHQAELQALRTALLLHKQIVALTQFPIGDSADSLYVEPHDLK